MGSPSCIPSDPPPGSVPREDAQVVELLNINEVAVALRVSEMTVYRLIRGGRLSAIRIGNSLRVDRHDLDRYLSAALLPRFGSDPFGTDGSILSRWAMICQARQMERSEHPKAWRRVRGSGPHRGPDPPALMRVMVRGGLISPAPVAAGLIRVVAAIGEGALRIVLDREKCRGVGCAKSRRGRIRGARPWCAGHPRTPLRVTTDTTRWRRRWWLAPGAALFNFEG